MYKTKELVKNILFILIVIIIFKAITSYQLAKTNLKTYDYTVTNGETLWNIAGKICSENNNLYIKNVINDIKRINNLESPIIYEGQAINLPIYN